MTREELDKRVERGELVRRREVGLHKGRGNVIIYKDKKHNYDSPVYESGYVVLPGGSILGFHMHHFDAEDYIVLEGRVEINGSMYLPGEKVSCERGEGHYCKSLDDESVIRFIKRRG